MVRLYTRPESPCWYAEAHVGGVPIRFSTGVARGPGNRGRAREAAEKEVVRRESDRLAATSLRLVDLVGLFFQTTHKLKASTRNHYGKKLIAILAAMGAEPCTTITADRLKAYIVGRRGQTSDIQIRRELTALSSVFEWAADNDHVEVNPVRMVRKKHLGKPASHPRAIKPIDVSKLLAAAVRRSPKFWHPFLSLILETGMRHEEALSLKWDNIDFNRGMIDLPWEKEKKYRYKIVPLSDTALRTLASVPRYPASEWVFTNSRTMDRYTSIWKGFGRLRDLVGLKHVRIHDFRHTFGSYTRRLGMDHLDRKSIMGHSSEVAHALYAETDERSLRKVLNAHSPSTLLAQEREFAETDEES